LESFVCGFGIDDEVSEAADEDLEGADFFKDGIVGFVESSGGFGGEVAEIGYGFG
jgi:hypothetical protein